MLNSNIALTCKCDKYCACYSRWPPIWPPIYKKCPISTSITAKIQNKAPNCKLWCRKHQLLTLETSGVDLVHDMTGRNDVVFQLATALLGRNLGICTNEAQDSVCSCRDSIFWLVNSNMTL